MSIRLIVQDRVGGEHEVETTPERSLMETLRELDYGVSAICGGMCSCATCHVYIAPEWLAKLPVRQSDEGDLLSELQFRQHNSRLSCQIQLKQEFDGLRLIT